MDYFPAPSRPPRRLPASAPPLTARDFVVLSALVVPSEAAAPSASLEWRAIRTAWLSALSAYGLSEDLARRQASTQRGQALAALLRTDGASPPENAATPFSARPQSPQETGL